MKNNLRAVSIAEILIVILLILILGLIAFYSFSGYLVGTRDSSRIVELENISTSLGSYVLKSGFYPEPSDNKNITYSGAKVWSQGKFGKSVIDVLGYSQDVVDPKYDVEYTYSIKNSRKEYMIAGVLEEPQEFAFGTQNSSSTYASNGEKEGVAIVKGNYNGELVSVKLGYLDYILAIPSIISSDLSSVDLVDILDNNKLVYNSYSNLPASYTGTKYNLDGNLDFSSNDLVVYSGSISDLKQAYYQVSLLQNVFNSYSGTLLGKEISVNKIDEDSLFSATPGIEIKKHACDLINFKVKYFVECSGIDYITFFIINVLHIDIGNLPGNKINSVFQDEDGNYVFGTNQGLAFHDGVSWITYTKQNSDLVRNFITSITQDNNGNYWIGTDNGISKLEIGDMFDPSDDVWTTYDKDILFKSHIQYIYTDSYGVVWIGTNQGVTTYNGEVWTDYTEKTSGLTHDNITAIYNDSNGHVWFGTNSKGIDKYTLSDGSVENYNSGDLPDHRVTYIYESTTGDIWVGTEGGLAKTSDYGTTWDSYTTVDGLVDDYITYIFESTTGEMWFGTKGGVSMYDGVLWENYTVTDGLKGDYVYLLYEDEFQSIIVFSDGGIDTIDNLGNILP